MTNLNPRLCSKMIFKADDWAGGRYQCSRKWVVEAEDGDRYCAQHNPIKVAERRAQQKADFSATMANAQRVSRIQAACEGVPDEQLQPGMLKKILDYFSDLTDSDALDKVLNG